MITTTYQLKFPIKHGEREILELVVTKPTPKILKKYDMANLNMQSQISLASDCTNEPPSLIEALDLDDYMGVINILTDWFLAASKR